MKDEITVRASDLCVVLHMVPLIEDRMVGEQLAFVRLGRAMDEAGFGAAYSAAEKLLDEERCARCGFALGAFGDSHEDRHGLMDDDLDEFPLLRAEASIASEYHPACCLRCGLHDVMKEADRDAARARD